MKDTKFLLDLSQKKWYPDSRYEKLSHLTDSSLSSYPTDILSGSRAFVV